jgi:DNA-binding LytR/AlgR family response regulator
VTNEGRKFPSDQTLEALEDLLDPKAFHRANRQFIIGYNSIDVIHPYFKGRMKIDLKPPTDLDLVISAEKTPEFKHWLDQ